ncbi:peptidase S8/S53 family protein [Gottschalkia acidurici 9a]|uniref:Peptidase S8/S53 family protein n=1 Tax=Gottschalkia acidurici (strain ATCC 7906 / DSM 604 / BCRC 14475 / CIP 104303 / KCTC 5404 / NCIMB 10678 / 9a) TaxID=1128398 RepID=K0B2Y4_GOTA9
MKRSSNLRVCPIVSAKLTSRSREDIPVIVSVKDNDSEKLSNMVFNMSSEVRHTLPLVGGVACSLNLDAINRLSRHPNIEYICFDSKVFALLDIASSTVSASIPHDLGFTGKDITVAVIDTGVAPHADLVKPRNRIIGFKDFVNNKTSPYDDNGHGTHVAGIIAASGSSSNGKYRGVAPNANILAVKALDATGGGNTSDIVSAIQ